MKRDLPEEVSLLDTFHARRYFFAPGPLVLEYAKTLLDSFAPNLHIVASLPPATGRLHYAPGSLKVLDLYFKRLEDWHVFLTDDFYKELWLRTVLPDKAIPVEKIRAKLGMPNPNPDWCEGCNPDNCPGGCMLGDHPLNGLSRFLNSLPALELSVAKQYPDGLSAKFTDSDVVRMAQGRLMAFGVDLELEPDYVRVFVTHSLPALERGSLYEEVRGHYAGLDR